MRHYNLPHNDKYTFIEITDNGEGNFTTCDNCGAIIRYVAHIKNCQNKSFYVGTECVVTLQGANITNEFSMLEQIRAFKKLAAINNLIQNNDNLKIWCSSKKTFAVAVGYNKNKKPLKLQIEKQFDPFLNESYKFIDTFLDTIQPQSVQESWCFNDIFVYYNKLKKQVS